MRRMTGVLVGIAVGVLVAAALPVAAAGCGNGGASSGGAEAGSPDGCVGAACAAACTGDEQCGAGLYCSSGTCRADCGPATPCASGLTCSARGRCGAGDAATPDGATTCTVVATPVRRGVVFMMGRTPGFSAEAPDAGGMSNAAQLQEVLLGDAGLVARRRDDIAFGGVFHGGCGDLNVVPVGATTQPALNAAFPQLFDAPAVTAESVRLVFDGGAPALGSFTTADGGQPLDPFARVLVLVVADRPTQCDGGVGTVAGVRNALSVARGLGVRTVVWGFETDGGLSASEVDSMALSGGLSLTAAQAVGIDAIRTSIAALEADLPTCDYSLSRALKPGLTGALSLKLDETPLLGDDPHGFNVVAPDRIRLTGAMCTYRKQRTVTLTATAPCDALVP